MVPRIRDIAISVLFSLVLLGPAAVYACELLHVDLPSWVTAEDAKYLSGGVKDGNVKANLSPAGFASGKLQDAIANEVGNRVPFKAAAMLGNAAGQRGVIALANVPFGWECYPTYYGSSRVYIPSASVVGYIPRREPEGQLMALRALGENAAGFAERNPNVEVVVLAVQGYRDPAVSPAYALVSDAMTPAEQVAVLREGVGDASNVRVVSVGYDTLEDYYADYFRTDHHWNHRGAERAYNAVAEELGLPAFEPPEEEPIEGYLYSGATARWGLDLVSEEVSGAVYDFSYLTVVSPDGSSKQYGHSAFLKRSDPGKRYAFYDSYYDFIPIGGVIEGPGEGSAVMVCNSYGGGIAPYIAAEYSEMLDFAYIHPSHRDASIRLENIVRDHDASTVFIVADFTDLAGFQTSCPDFFAAI